MSQTGKLANLQDYHENRAPKQLTMNIKTSRKPSSLIPWAMTCVWLSKWWSQQWHDTGLLWRLKTKHTHKGNKVWVILVYQSWICYLRFHWSSLFLTWARTRNAFTLYVLVCHVIRKYVQVCQFTMTSRMRHYSVYGTICKHWQEETSECALILFCVW